MGEVGCSAGTAELGAERRVEGCPPRPTPLPPPRPQLTKSYGSQPSKRKGKVMAHEFSWAQWPKTIGGLPEMGLRVWKELSEAGPRPQGDTPHQAIWCAHCSPNSLPPRPLHPPRLPWGPEGRRPLAAGRIRRACFSFTGASWVLMALLMLMAWEGTEEAEVRNPPGRLPGRDHPKGEGATHRTDPSRRLKARVEIREK